MQRLILLFLLLFTLPLLAQDAELDEFFLNLLRESLQSEQEVYLVKDLHTSTVYEIKNDRGKTGYITYQFQAEVVTTYKGKPKSQPRAELTYYQTYEAGIEPEQGEHAFIISGTRTQDDRLVLTENGFKLRSSEKLLSMLKQLKKQLID
jgi:hypothetical protein